METLGLVKTGVERKIKELNFSGARKKSEIKEMEIKPGLLVSFHDGKVC